MFSGIIVGLVVGWFSWPSLLAMTIRRMGGSTRCFLMYSGGLIFMCIAVAIAITAVVAAVAVAVDVGVGGHQT